MGNHIHEQKCTNNKPYITLFKIELKHYIKGLKEIKKQKRIKKMSVCSFDAIITVNDNSLKYCDPLYI